MNDDQIIERSIAETRQRFSDIVFGSVSVEFTIHGGRITKTSFAATKRTLAEREGVADGSGV